MHDKQVVILDQVEKDKISAHKFFITQSHNQKAKSNSDLFEELAWKKPDFQRECVEERCSLEELDEALSYHNNYADETTKETAVDHQWRLFHNKCVYGKPNQRCSEENTEVCVNFWNDLQCICKAGWTGDFCRNDIDECTSKTQESANFCLNIDPQMSCQNTIGSFDCICNSGFEENLISKANGGSRSCININECGDATHEDISGCTQICNDTEGSFYCSCQSGYILDLDDNKTCLDQDECSHPSLNICNSNFECENFDGGYQCVCHEGYQHADLHLTEGHRKECVDIDECSSDSLNNCRENSKCINLPGSYECQCKTGFIHKNGDTKSECIDLNECETNNGNCQHTCNNMIGSYTCECFAGYTRDSSNDHFCVDVNECLYNNGDCPENSTCENLEGSFQCLCVSGYEIAQQGDSMATTCVDVDECLKDPCLVGESCVNEVGSFRFGGKSCYTLMLPVSHQNIVVSFKTDFSNACNAPKAWISTPSPKVVLISTSALSTTVGVKALVPIQKDPTFAHARKASK